MATPPTFSAGAVLTAAQMNAVGLWLIKTETIGSAVASVQVTSVFSSDYDNYKIVISGVSSSVAQAVCRFTLGASTASYYSSYRADVFSGVTAINRVNNGAYAEVGQFNTQQSFFTLDLCQPNAADETQITGNYASTGVTGWCGAYHGVATAYTSFTVTPSSGTLTGGKIRVYGYRN